MAAIPFNMYRLDTKCCHTTIFAYIHVWLPWSSTYKEHCPTLSGDLTPFSSIFTGLPPTLAGRSTSGGSQSTALATQSAHGGSQSAAPAMKSSQRAAPATKSAHGGFHKVLRRMARHQACELHNIIYPYQPLASALLCSAVTQKKTYM